MTTPQPRRPLHDVAAGEAQRLAADGNVVSVGVGLKEVNGKPTMEVALHTTSAKSSGKRPRSDSVAASRYRARSRATRPMCCR